MPIRSKRWRINFTSTKSIDIIFTIESEESRQFSYHFKKFQQKSKFWQPNRWELVVYFKTLTLRLEYKRSLI